MKTWWTLAALAITTPLLAEQNDWVDGMQPIATPAQPGAIALPVSLPRAHPASEAWAQQGGDQRLAYNVAAPQLVPMPSSLPAGQVAPAVLLVPGGGFQFLSMDNEGYAVARRLDRLGVRVFIVKYRTHPIAGGFDGFKAALTEVFVNDAPVDEDDVRFAVADTQAAIRMVRARAGEWRVDPAKVGILGFSAGAMTVLGTTQANAADAHPDFARPDFVGMIYGPTAGSNVPPNAPPLFAAIAADDQFFMAQDLSLIHAWRQAGRPVELHLYSGGGHGFASYPNGTTSDAWFDQWALWLRAMGIIGAAT